MKILVIDDDPDVVEAVSLTFEMRWPGSNVVSSPDGETGIQMVDTERPALVFLDIGLADMDGFTVCQEMRRFSDVPVIMVTVREKEADIVHGLQVGADDYILKPFRPIELMARVQTVLRRTHVSSFSGDEKPFSYGDLMVDFSHWPGVSRRTTGQAHPHRVPALVSGSYAAAARTPSTVRMGVHPGFAAQAIQDDADHDTCTLDAGLPVADIGANG